MKPRLIFMGTPVFATAVLRQCIHSGYTPIAVVTQPDKPIGRKRLIQASAVKELAIEYQIPVFQPTKLGNEFQEILDLKPDLILTCAYGQMLPRPLLEVPRLGCINVHASLLPKYRGGAPIHWAVIQGEASTGVTLMKTVMKMDAGPICAQAEVKIAKDDTTSDVHDRLMIAAANLVEQNIEKIINEQIQFYPQQEDLVSYAYNIRPQDEKIDIHKPGQMVYNQIRGLIQWPVGYVIIDHIKCKIHQAQYVQTSHHYSKPIVVGFERDAMIWAVKDGYIYVYQLQIEGRKIQSAQEFAHGIGRNWINKEIE